jgi:hypothetical protein
MINSTAEFCVAEITSAFDLSPRSLSRQAKMTVAPSYARAIPVALPRLPVAPVMEQTLPFILSLCSPVKGIVFIKPLDALIYASISATKTPITIILFAGRVNFTPQAESASPTVVTPANLRKSLRQSLFLFILEKS